ncbi:ejaculatory bulb-specific protein 3-like [Lycorma delicatula]|uniref:ejaculatory bulb-specific protein 3-like n=1 Tax=Lycorma delicatula TaxID=130591 RepID=UPI003F5140BC
MMKFVLIASFLVIAVSAKPADKKYTTKYDNIDIDEIINNERLFKNYFSCIMGTGKCTPIGVEMKDLIPDALANRCAKCNEKQKASTGKLTKFLIEKKPEQFKELEKKYDPEGKYRAAYKDDAAKLGIKI